MPTRKEEEFELFKKYKKEDDKQAKKQLVKSLTPLIRSQVGKYKASGVPYEALELEGKRLASKAIDTYDEDKGTQLNTHVTNYLQKLYRFTVENQNVGYIPEPRALLLGKYKTIFSNLEAEKGREPTVTELADAMQVSQAEIERIQSEQRKDLHMELPSTDPDEGGFSYYVMPDTEDPQLRQALEFVYFDTDSTNKKILEWTFGMGGAPRKTAKEIKEKLNLTETELRKRREQLSKEIKELL